MPPFSFPHSSQYSHAKSRCQYPIFVSAAGSHRIDTVETIWPRTALYHSFRRWPSPVVVPGHSTWATRYDECARGCACAHRGADHLARRPSKTVWNSHLVLAVLPPLPSLSVLRLGQSFSILTLISCVLISNEPHLRSFICVIFFRFSFLWSFLDFLAIVAMKQARLGD